MLPARRLAVAVLAAAIGASGTARGAEPQRTVKVKKLDAALSCSKPITRKSPQPVVFSTGTGTLPDEGYGLMSGAAKRLGRPFCFVRYPGYTTADIQVSAQYLVYAVRTVSRRAGRPVAIYGISQGALLPRFALTFWPSLRAKVSDVVAVSGTQHGTTATSLVGSVCSPYKGCPPAFWQQAAGSQLLTALNRPGRDETPGATSWTTVRSATDEVVQPQTSDSPTSSLAGATNILIQDVCPGREVSHIGTVPDSVAFAAFRDAITHPGAADPSRLPATVCDTRYAPGIDETQTDLALSIGAEFIATRASQFPYTFGEPPLRPYLK